MQMPTAVPTDTTSSSDTCSVCDAASNPALLMLCESPDCGARVHTFCATPQMPFVPTGAWYCEDHADEGEVQLFPDPGDKVMVLIKREMRWWPAVVLPSDADYLPAKVPRKSGGMLERSCKTFRSGHSTRRGGVQLSQSTVSTSSRHLVVAYYAQPLRHNSQFASCRLDWDKVRPLDFDSEVFNRATPSQSIALSMAKAFDLDVTADSFSLVRNATRLVCTSDRERLMAKLTEGNTTLQDVCAEGGVSYATARDWLKGTVVRETPLRAEWLTYLESFIGVSLSGVEASVEVSVEAVVEASVEGEGSEKSPIRSGKAKRSRSPTALSPQVKRMCIRSMGKLFERNITPLGALLLRFLNLSCRGAASDEFEPVQSALQAMHGITPNMLGEWVHGTSKNVVETEHIGRVVKHTLVWHLGEKVVHAVEQSGLAAIPHQLKML